MNRARPLLPSSPGVLLAALLLAPASAPAQAPDSTSTVETTGTAEVSLRPTSALLRVGVSSLAETAAAASDSSARKTRALRDTLTALGFDGDSLRTASFSVGPRWEPEPPREPGDRERRRVYEARATLEVPVDELSRLDRVLDAVLAAGADRVPDVEYSAGGTDAARERALRSALRRARSEARALAREAGGRLGPMLHATSPPADRPGGEMMAARALDGSAGGGAGVSLVPPDVVVRATVTARWAVRRAGGR